MVSLTRLRSARILSRSQADKGYPHGTVKRNPLPLIFLIIGVILGGTAYEVHGKEALYFMLGGFACLGLALLTMLRRDRG